MKELKRYGLLLFFFGFLFLFMILDMAVPNKTYSEIENRQLATMPKLTYSSLTNNTFTSQFEVYLNDHFLLRDGWITLKSVSESVLLKTENNGIVYGSDHYLFEKNRDALLAYYDRNLGRVAQFIEANPDAHIIVGLVPGAEHVLSDKVPGGLPLFDQESLIEEAYQVFEHAGARTLDLYTPLRLHSDDYIYYRTDHHWTTWGAQIACENYLKLVNRPSVDLGQYPVYTVEGFLGTHYNKAKNWNVVADTIAYYDMPFSNITVDNEVKATYYDPAMFDLRDKYAAFMWGNSGLTTLSTTDDPETRLLVIKDSYANTLVPMLSRSYDEIVLIDLRASAFRLSDYLAEEHFDEILVLYSFRSFGSDNNIVKITY